MIRDAGDLGWGMWQGHRGQWVHDLAYPGDLHGIADVANQKAHQVLGLVVALTAGGGTAFHRLSRGSSAKRIRMSLGSSRSCDDERPRVRTARGRPMPITYSLR